MKEWAYTLNLKDDPQAIAAYKQHHRHVWREVEETLRRVGVRKMRVFLHGRQLFMYIETDNDFDPIQAATEYMKVPASFEWEQLMRSKFQEQLPEAKPEEWWLLMDPIYALDT